MGSVSWSVGLADEESGAASIEYALLISGIAVGMVAVGFSLGVAVYGLYDSAVTAMSKEM